MARLASVSAMTSGMCFENSEVHFVYGICTHVELASVVVHVCFALVSFPEYAQILAKEGCRLLIYPGAFNMTTGPPHWELLQRARALGTVPFLICSWTTPYDNMICSIVCARCQIISCSF